MNTNDKKNWIAFLEKWVPFFIIGCTLIGAVLGSFLVYCFQGAFLYEILIAGLIVAAGLSGVEMIKQKRKKDNIPDSDERVARNVFRLFTYISYIFLAILFITVGVLTLLGNETIEIIYLWIFFFLYIWIAGLGVLIIKRR